jgi:hypothetical protein
MPVLARLRQQRHLVGAALLAVLLALLPLRGWAETAMHLGTPGAMAELADAALPPCHGAMAGDDADGASVPMDDAAAACSLCALCHAAAAPASEPIIEFDVPAAGDVAVFAVGAPAPALPLPERPPRA